MEKKSISFGASNLIGIDIGNSAVRMAQIKGHTTELATARLPENMVRDGRIVTPELMARFIKDMKGAYNFNGKKCALILPEFSTFFRNLNIPPMTTAQLNLNLPYEFRDYVGDGSSLYNYDYAVEKTNIGEDGEVESIDLLAAAALKETVNQYEEICKRAGLRLALALPREMALINMLKMAADLGGEIKGYNALVDLGYNYTRIYVFNGTHITASRLVEIGCKDIDDAIAAYYNIDTYLANSYRESNFQNVLQTEECREIYTRIALEIMKAMNFYRYENPDHDLNDIYFSGSGSTIGDLTEEIITVTEMNGHKAAELLPVHVEDEELAAYCVMALAVTMQKGRY